MSYIPPKIDDNENDWKDYNDTKAKIGYTALPNCPLCHGKGYLFPMKEGIIDFQHPTTCNYKDCLRDSIKLYRSGESYLTTIGINPVQTLAAFSQELGTEKTYAAFYYLAKPEERKGEDKRRRPFLLCYGGVGNGKTHLCNAVALELNFQKIGVRMYAAADLMSDLWAGMNNHTLDMKLEFVKTIPALIIDDYGVNYGAELELSWMDQIIDSRYRDEKITILTMNKDISTLSERVKSRFFDAYLSVAVLNQGVDRRPLK